MNYPIAATFCLICLAFIAHMVGGVRESLSVRPAASRGNEAHTARQEIIERNWVQLMCAFQLVSVDLLTFAGVLYLLAFTTILQPAWAIAMGMAAVFALWGISWLVQLASLKRPAMDYLRLGHWLFWFLCSSLMFWGASTL